MFKTVTITISLRNAFMVTLLSLFALSGASQGQVGTDVEGWKTQVRTLLNQGRQTETVPLLEKIVAAEPTNAEMHYFLASALLATAVNTKEAPARAALRRRARNTFIRAKELGARFANIDAMIQGLPANGADAAAFSENQSAESLMKEAEGYFGQGKMDEALASYQKALAVDPKLYHAALFSGDVYAQKQDYANAEIWYQKAIAIDPSIETAYRYSATPLMKQHKYDEARDRYIEAYITEPYNKFTTSGLLQWGQATNTRLGHPKIDIPTSVTFDEKGDAKINLDSSALLSGKEDGSFAWISYGATRSTWHKETFAKRYPGQKYRHSLAEEADALRSVITLATSDKAVKNLSPALAKLKQLNDQGVLEAYILLAIPDADIAQDYRAYLKENRDKLRRYVLLFVVNRG
jgi:tetratricopeptide (TPR) repeat protein